jgi:hypothetical protein
MMGDPSEGSRMLFVEYLDEAVRLGAISAYRSRIDNLELLSANRLNWYPAPASFFMRVSQYIQIQKMPPEDIPRILLTMQEELPPPYVLGNLMSVDAKLALININLAKRRLEGES